MAGITLTYFYKKHLMLFCVKLLLDRLFSFPYAHINMYKQVDIYSERVSVHYLSFVSRDYFNCASHIPLPISSNKFIYIFLWNKPKRDWKTHLSKHMENAPHTYKALNVFNLASPKKSWSEVCPEVNKDLDLRPDFQNR